MNTLKSKQARSFQDRLDKIAAENELPPTGPVSRSPQVKRAAVTDRPRRKIPVGALIAAALAVASLLIANITLFQVRLTPLGPGNYFAKVALGIGVWGITGLLLFVVMVGFGLRDKAHVIGIALALPAFYFAEPYLAALLPEVWGMLYSPQHVDNMLIQAGLRMPPLAQ